MNILSIECATEAASVALLTAGGVRERGNAGEKQSAFLLPAVEALLADCGVSRSAIDGIAVSRGPGAFTGVRFGLAVAQGLALGLDRPAVAVSTLAALALQASGDSAATRGTVVLALIDARMDEVYGGAFAYAGGDSVTALENEFLSPPDAVVGPEGEALLVAGSGLAAYGMRIGLALGTRRFVAAAESAPSAAAVARLAVHEFAAGRSAALESLRPVYLRDKVALTEAERGKRSEVP